MNGFTNTGGIPASFTHTFTAMQTVCPEGVPESRWRLAINDAGLFLDQWCETVMPRSASSSSTSRKLSVKRKYIQTARWMMSRGKR
jgi:hypothetical protein